MARTSNRGGGNNNPQGINQYSSGWMDSAKERPVATAAAAAAAVGAGVFLWNRRNQISDQISNLSDQVTSWAEGMASGSGSSNEMDTTSSGSSGSRSSQMGSRGSTGRSSSGRTGSSSATGSSSSNRRSGKSGRGSGGLDEIGVIEVDTVTL
jgi:hypothetical protein